MAPSSDGGDDGDTGDGSDDQRQPSTAEKAVMAVSVAFAVLLFAYAGWQMVDEPTDVRPTASVEGTETLPDGTVAVTVRLRNPSDAGLVSATIQSDCASPPSQVGFAYIPASSTRTGTLVCPGDTADPSVSVANWVRP